jgi:hypothetical protein
VGFRRRPRERVSSDSQCPLGFNNLGSGVNLHQLWAYVGKEANTDGCGWDWGARVDYVFGVDGPDTQAFRGTQWDVGWTDGDYGSAIPQAYAEIAINYLTVKAGYFYTSIGYEVVQAPQNFFYSHSYTQYYIEPFTPYRGPCHLRWLRGLHVLRWMDGRMGHGL